VFLIGGTPSPHRLPAPGDVAAPPPKPAPAEDPRRRAEARACPEAKGTHPSGPGIMLISLAQSTLQPAPTLNPAPSWMKRLVEVEFNFPATTTNRYAVAPPSILDTLSGGNNPRSWFFFSRKALVAELARAALAKLAAKPIRPLFRHFPPPDPHRQAHCRHTCLLPIKYDSSIKYSKMTSREYTIDCVVLYDTINYIFDTSHFPKKSEGSLFGLSALGGFFV